MPDVVDLYCGAGGWSVALNRLGLTHYGYDNNRDAVSTYELAVGDASIFDLSDLTPPRIKITGIVASPPCQPYSKAGKQQGRNDPRGMHPLTVLRWAEVTAPHWIAVEQVAGASAIFNRLAVGLAQLGYRVATYGLDAETFGVPQTRHRIILMARLDRKPERPTRTHSKFYPHQPKRLDPDVLQWVTMAQALGWDGLVGFPRRADDARPVTINGIEYRARDLRPTDEPAPTVTSKARSWTLTRPSPTIVGSYRAEVVAAPKWRTTVSRQNEPDSVIITPQEGGILQSFPADYPWQGSRTSQFRQVGNAIPPLMAQAVIEALIKEYA